MASDDFAVITGAVLDVAGVKADRHSVRVGVLEKGVNELLSFNVCVDVGVESKLNVELLFDHSTETVLSADQVSPLVCGQFGGLIDFTSPQIGEHLR